MKYSRKKFRKIRTLLNYLNVHLASTKIADKRMKWNTNFENLGKHREPFIGPKLYLCYRKFPVASGTACSGISGKLDKQLQDNLLRYTDSFGNSHWEFSLHVSFSRNFWSTCSRLGNSNFWIFWKLSQEISHYLSPFPEIFGILG